MQRWPGGWPTYLSTSLMEDCQHWLYCYENTEISSFQKQYILDKESETFWASFILQLMLKSTVTRLGDFWKF